MRKTKLIAAATLAALAVAGPAAGEGRPVPPDGPVEATIYAPTCGPGGRTVVAMDFTTNGHAASLRIVRRYGMNSRFIETPEGEGLRRLEFRVRASQPLALRLFDGANLVTETELSGYPCR